MGSRSVQSWTVGARTVRDSGRGVFVSLTAVLVAATALLPAARAFAAAPTFNTFIPTSTNSSFNFPGSAAVGDFNGDGKLDALVTDGSQQLRLMLGNGDGTFTERDVSVPGANPNPIKAVDLNGDGKLDAVIVSNGGNLAATVLINTGNDVNGVPQFTVTNYVIGSLRSVTVGDLNGDGAPDVIVGDAFGNVRVLLNNGDGTFTLPAGQTYGLQPGAGGPSVGAGAIVDLDDDGKADYIVASNQNHATNIFFGNGDGTLQSPVVIPSHGLFIAVADVDHDGKPDFVEVDPGSGDPSSGRLMVYVNNGDRTFSGPTLYPTGLSVPFSVTTADLDGDGNVDAAISDLASNRVAVLLGNGSGAFGAASLYTVNQGPRDVSVADFNGDGKLDIATVGQNDRTYGVLLNTSVTATPPVITSNIAGALGNAGWFTSTVVASWNVQSTAPLTSSVDCGSTTIDVDTAGTTLTCTAANAGGSTSQSVTVKRDATGPTIAFSGGGSVGVNQSVSVNCTASDSLSGVASSTCGAPLASGPGYTFALGVNTVNATATDVAGNATQASASFSVTVSADSLCALTRAFSTNSGIATALCAKLTAAAASTARDAATAKAGQLGAYVNQVAAQSGKAFTSAQAAILTRLAQQL